MTPEEVIYRALGVPDVLGPESKSQAAAAALLRAANITRPLARSTRFNPDELFRQQLRSGGAVVAAVLDTAATGRLDPMIGGYSIHDEDEELSALAEDIDDNLNQIGDQE